MTDVRHLPDNTRLTIAPPARFSSQIRQSYLRLLAEGEAVAVPDERRLTSASLWAVVQEPESGLVVAAGALKQTRLNPLYYRKLFSPQKASLYLAFNEATHPFDLGWLVTASAFRRRGYCEAIMDALLAHSTNRGVLATTQHPGIREKLLRKGFVQRGRSWPAADGGGVSLYLRSHHDK